MRLLVLGPVTVEVNGQRRSLRRAQNRGVLALLALNPNRALSLEAVIDAIWDGAAPPTARTQVHSAIREIRGLFAALGRHHVIESGRFGYRLNIDPEFVDACRFQLLVEQARSSMADSNPEHARQLLRAGLDLFAGQPLADAAGAYIESTRARLTQARLAAIEDLADLELAHGRPELVAAELIPLVQQHPLRERLRCRLMLAFYRSGQQAAALQTAREYRHLLREEQGLDPGPELVELEGKILRAEPSLRPGPQPEGTPRSSVAAAPATTGLPVPAQLPPDLSTFTGRTAYLERLDSLLSGGGPAQPVVISTLSGAAGVGKTALAVHWGHRVRASFPDGQLYLNLRGYDTQAPLTPMEGLARFLRALGVPSAQVPDDVDEASALYRSLLADRRVLVVLDNARDAEQVRPLLPGSSTALVLITSRDRLDGLVAIDGADRIDLDALSAEEAYGLLSRVLGPTRVQAEPEQTSELARLCAHLPLALSIAAARLAAQPGRRIGDFVEELKSEDRLSALAIRADGRAAVRGAFDLSYNALPQAARRTFRMIGLAPGPDVTAEALAAVTATQPAVAAEQLTTLARAHLVQQQTPGRYALHDLLRAYARERAGEEDNEAERASAWNRLLDHYLSMVDQATRLISPEMVRLPLQSPHTTNGSAFDEAGAAWSWLDAERHNLVAAICAAARSGPRRLAWLLADALRGYFYRRMFTVEWRMAAEAALSAAEAEGDSAAQAALLNSLGQLAWAMGRYDDAIRTFTAALGVAEHCDWTLGRLSILNNLACVHAMQGRLAEAARAFEAALEGNRSLGYVGGEAAQLANLGQIYFDLGRLSEALDYLEQAVALYRSSQAWAAVGFATRCLGECLHMLGRPREAHEQLVQALGLAQETGDRKTQMLALRTLAELHAQAGRLTEAHEACQSALELSREIRHRTGEVLCLLTLGDIQARLGEHVLSVKLHLEAVSLVDGIGAEVTATAALAAAQVRVGDVESARRNAQRALALARRCGYRVEEGNALTALARIDLEQSRPKDAARRARQACRIQEDCGYQLGVARALAVLAEATRRLGDESAAAAHRRRADDILAALDAVEAP